MPETVIYDLRGLKCPLPALRSAKRLAAMKPGARLWIETTDPLATIDIPALCQDEGHILVEREAAADGHRFLVERGPGRKS